MLFLILILAAVVAIISLVTTVYAGFMAAPFVPTPKKVIRRALEEIKLDKNELLYDLGSGNGRVIIMASKEFGVRSVGFELSFHHYLISKLNIFLNGCIRKATARWKNFLNEDLSEANVIFIWLTPKGNRKLEEKLNKELKPGTRVAVFSSPLNFWRPYKILENEGSGKLFFYKVG